MSCLLFCEPKKKRMRGKMTTKQATQTVVIKQADIYWIALEIKGDSDLIMNNFAQKSIEEMLRKHMGISVQREAKKPRELIEQAKIKNTDGRLCIDPIAFKKAMLEASTSIKSFKKTQLRPNLFVEGSSVPITYDQEVPRMDVVRLAGIGRTPDIRFRPAFTNWKARLVLKFTELLNVQSVVDLLNRAGNVGVGEWRPSRDGTFGRFHVSRQIDDLEEVDEIRAQCTAPLVAPVIPEWALDADLDPQTIADVMDDAGKQERNRKTQNRRGKAVAS